MIRKHLLTLSIGLTLGLATAGSAQDRATVWGLEMFRSQLNGFVTSARLTRLIRELQQQSVRQPEDRVTSLRVGLVMLRLAVVTDGREFSKARDHFRQIAEAEPTWAYPEFGIGLAEQGRGDWLAGNPAELGNRVGYGSYRAAIESFSAALEKDPRFESAALALAYLARRVPDSAMVAQSISILERIADYDSVGSEVRLMAGRLLRDNEAYPAALHWFRRARQHDGNHARAEFEIGRTLLAMGVATADSVYYATATTDDVVIVGWLRADLAPIADEHELAQFDSLSGTFRAAWLYRFWSRRDQYDLRSPGERLAEHYRRLYYVRHHFALQVNRRYFTGVDLFRNLDRELDDRGVVYVRQGEPDERITAPIFGLNGNETWIYRQPAGDLILHFGAGGLGDQGGASDDYRLVSSLLDIWRPGAPSDLLLLSRSAASDLYNRMLGWGAYGRARAAAEERKLGEQSALTGVTTDGYQLHYEHPLHAAAELLVFESPPAAQLHVVFAIPRDSSCWEPVRVRLGLFNPAMESAVAFDTTVSPASYSPAFDADLGHVILQVPVGKWRYRLAIERGTSGRLFPDDSIAVGHPGEFELSDLALAAPEAGIVWQPAPGDSVMLSPFQAFQRDRSIEVYYEVYGLAPGRHFETRIAVLERRDNRRGRQKLELAFSEESGGGVNRLRRTVQLNGLQEGSYWLEVRVRDASGTERWIRRAFQVTD